MTLVDDRADRPRRCRPGTARPPRPVSASPTGRSAGPAAGDVLQPLERQRQVRAATSADHGVDFVDDHRPDRAQQLAAALRREQQVERLRRRHQDVRRRAQHRRALGLRRVAGADGRGDAGAGSAVALGVLPDAAARLREVLVDVGAQRLQRRDVDDPDLIRQRAAAASCTSASIAVRNAASVLPEPVGAAISVCWPSRIAAQPRCCALRRRTDAVGEPAGDERMKTGDGHREPWDAGRDPDLTDAAGARWHG